MNNALIVFFFTKISTICIPPLYNMFLINLKFCNSQYTVKEKTRKNCLKSNTDSSKEKKLKFFLIAFLTLLHLITTNICSFYMK